MRELLGMKCQGGGGPSPDIAWISYPWPILRGSIAVAQISSCTLFAVTHLLGVLGAGPVSAAPAGLSWLRIYGCDFSHAKNVLMRLDSFD